MRISGIGTTSNGNFIGLQTNTDVYYSHIKVSPVSPLLSTHLFIGTQTGQVFKVINAQSSPVVSEITGADFPAAYVSCIAVGQTEDDLLVCFSNYGVPSVWLTSDGGESWRNVEGNLPDIPVRWAIYHPANDGQALLATELGVWSTTELNNEEVTWVQDINGLANVRVDMLQLRPSDNMVLAASHGRGFFTAEYLLDPYVSVAEEETVKISVYPNPSTGIFNVLLPAIKSGMAEIQVYNVSGREVYSSDISAGSNSQNHQINLLNQPKGNYILKMILDGKSYSEKVVTK